MHCSVCAYPNNQCQNQKMPKLLETIKLKSATNSALVHSVTIALTFVDLKLCNALLILLTSAKILLPLCTPLML